MYLAPKTINFCACLLHSTGWITLSENAQSCIIINELGLKVKEQSGKSIFIGDLANGIYNVKFIMKNGFSEIQKLSLIK